ncbi:MAG: ABC transporter substrate-binding protein [Candidatus Tectomicrobia bacterium]|nr:ABC transporter substrate-binding protein [Candidatus Tectomicrobia bacterium]
MKNHALASLCCLLAGILLLGSAGAKSQGAVAKPAGDAFTLGWISPITGFGAEFAKANEYALQFALDDLTAAGGIHGLPLRFIRYDSASKPEEAIRAANRLITQDKVLAILGPYFSTESRVLFPVANRSKIVAISSVSAAPGIAAENRPWTFRNVMTSDRTIGPVIERFLKLYPGVKTAAIMYDNKAIIAKSEGTQVFPSLLEARGVTIIATTTHGTGDIDFAGQVTKVKAANPDALVVNAMQNETVHIIRELRRQGVTQPIVMGISASTGMLPQRVGAAGNGAVLPSYFWLENPDPRAQRFIQRFRDATTSDPPHYSASHYDTVLMLAQALRDSGVTNRPEDLEQDRERLMRYLTNLKGFQGITGVTDIRADGDADKERYVFMIKDGAYVRLP